MWDVIPYVYGVYLCICIQIVINLYINFKINFVSWFSIFMILTLNFSFCFFLKNLRKQRVSILKTRYSQIPITWLNCLQPYLSKQCFWLSCPSPGCVPLQLQILLLDFRIESSLHLFSQPRIYFNFFIVILNHLFPINVVFIFSIFLVVCYKAHWKVDEMKSIRLKVHSVCLPGHLPR